MASEWLQEIVKCGLDSVPVGGGITACDFGIALAAVEACAAEIEAEGCVCEHIEEEAFRGKWAAYRTLQRGSLRDVVEIHDPRCPIALAARLRRLA